MEKKSLFIGLTLGACCLSLLALISSVIYEFTHLKMDTHLQNNIENTIATEKAIDFSKVTDFDWDTLYVFTPYSCPREILEDADIFTFNSNFDIERHDNIVMLGFVKNNRLISYVDISRDYFSHLPLTSMRFSKDTAIFKISQTETYPGDPNAQNIIYFTN